MPRTLAATSWVLLAAWGGGSIGPGVVCLLIPWSQISDPLLDLGAAPPAALILRSRLPLCPHRPVFLSL